MSEKFIQCPFHASGPLRHFNDVLWVELLVPRRLTVVTERTVTFGVRSGNALLLRQLDPTKRLGGVADMLSISEPSNWVARSPMFSYA
jgi:hypothetical protein